jgi:hypothetical protein
VDVERLRERHLRRGLDDAERPGDDLVVALIWLNRKRRASAGSRRAGETTRAANAGAIIALDIDIVGIERKRMCSVW